MMKFLLTFIIGIVFSFFVWVGIIFGQTGAATKGSQWVYDTYVKKQKLAKSIKQRKIVIVAGSNALFGIESKMLSRAFHMPVINYGVNAGIELPLTLELAKRVINRGDVVIAPLEYSMFSYDGEAGAQMMDYLLSREPSFFWHLSVAEQLYILWHIEIKRVWDAYFHKSKRHVTRGLYGPHHIDKSGDQIQSSAKYRKKWMYNEVQKYALHPERYGVKFKRNGIAWHYLEEFVQWCKERDVRVIFMPSTLLKDAFYFKDAKEKWFYEHLADEVRKRGWEYAGEPYDYMYAKENYFDTNFHLVDTARKKRTQQMIEDLNAYLKHQMSEL